MKTKIILNRVYLKKKSSKVLFGGFLSFQSPPGNLKRNMERIQERKFSRSEKGNLPEYVFRSLKNRRNIAQVECESGASITYDEVVFRSNYLGKRFYDDEIVKSGDKVCIIAKNSIDYVWILLGSLQAGAVCALYSPYAKKREIEHFIKLSKPKVVIAPQIESEILNVILSDENVQKIYTNQESSDPKVESYRKLSSPEKNSEITSKWEEMCQIDPDDPALILASSGSTGLPKGVVLTHKNLISTLNYRNLLMSQNGVGLGLMPFNHAYGLGLMLMALCEGVKFVTMAKFSMDAFLKTIKTYQVTHLYLVPSLVASLGKSENVLKKDLKTIRAVFTGAGPILSSHQCRLAEKLEDSAKMYHSYGMTETTHVVLTGEYMKEKPGSSGTLVPGVMAKIVDENGEVEIGKTGELCIKGSMVMFGYYENLEATQQTRDDDGWLHTGDLAYRDHDGHFFIVERLKEMIKYQGYQISPTEIELLLIQRKEISEVAVIGVPHEIYGELPTAYIVKNDEFDISEEDIKAFLSDELSPYKQLKGGINFVKQLPKSPSGKILKKHLKELHMK